jgi:superfamily II DNA/RNA helicase
MEQGDRIAEFDRFKRDEITVLVASDVAARGLDVRGVSHVFNFDVPWQPDDYVHRIGRTGRAGAKGTAITLATREDAEALARIEKLIGQPIARLKSARAEPSETPPSEEREEKPARAPRRKAEAPRQETRPARAAKTERPARPEPRRAKDLPPASGEEGWNGPLPGFLSVGLTSA